MTGSVILNMLFANLMIDIGREMTSPPPITCSGDNEVCYNIYNAEEKFFLGPPWSGTPTRPIHLLPWSPEEINTKFILYSSLNQTQPYYVDLNNMTSFLEAPFNTGQKLFVLVHGYKSSSSVPWMQPLRRSLQRFTLDQVQKFMDNSSSPNNESATARPPSGPNVVIVDWQQGAHGPYTRAVANLRVVARQVAYLIDALQEVFSISASNSHIIGHSLGAHLAGIAGHYLQTVYHKKLYRITGLDPASPYHSVNDTLTRLDTSDASFVDVIHSDNTTILGFPITVGMMEPIGHLDFYPNGAGTQPGCLAELKCNHVRAVYLFMDSLDHSCLFTSVRCSSYQSFLEGECWGCEDHDSCASMGIRAVPPAPSTSGPKQYYLLTKESSPFCDQHYRVSISVSNTTESFDHNGEFGILQLKMKGVGGTAHPIQLSEKSVYYKAGTDHMYVVLAPDIGRITHLRVTFRYPGHFFNPMSWRMTNPRLHMNKIVIEKLNSDEKSSFCFDSSEQESGIEYHLSLRDFCEE